MQVYASCLTSNFRGFYIYILLFPDSVREIIGITFYIYPVYNRLQLAKKYLHYYFTASNRKGHGMHSPFVFDFITTVLNDRQHYPAYDTVEKLREKLLGDPGLLTIQDFGAGSSAGSSNQRTIASIAKNAAKPKKYGQLLYRMVKKYQPATILELGTSLGITTSYLALAGPDAKLVTMEGAAEIAATARRNFAGLQLRQIGLIEGNFDEMLPSAIRSLPSIDFVFIDGNHRKEPTEQYFRSILPYTHNDSVLVFDDIHWSRGMEEAWGKIRADNKVRCTIDLFFIGIVFFRQEFKEKQHFSIRF
jgi:predicted O-methyltransferase YrrM